MPFELRGACHMELAVRSDGFPCRDVNAELDPSAAVSPALNVK